MNDEYEIIDRSYNQETGELQQFTVLWNGGEPELKKASPENQMLFDPEGILPFENGLYSFLNGQEALILSEKNPEALVAPTGNEYAYIVRINGDTVETTPNQAEEVLEAILDAIKHDDFDSLVDIYDEIRSSQVRKNIVNALQGTFDEPGRITISSRGWVVDDFYLVDWSASVYTTDDDPDEADYVRGGGGVQEVDKSYEFVQLNVNRDALNPIEVTINNNEFRLSEREMLFLAKVTWLLGRRHYHPDEPFWMYNDKWATVDEKTGEPLDDGDDDDPSQGKINF